MKVPGKVHYTVLLGVPQLMRFLLVITSHSADGRKDQKVKLFCLSVYKTIIKQMAVPPHNAMFWDALTSHGRYSS